MSADNTPVLIGVAQQTWRERDASRTPLDGLEAVARAALADSAARQALPIDAVAVVPLIMTQVPELADAMPRNLGAALTARLGLSATSYGAGAGGNLPQSMVNHFAAAVVAGEHRAALICGAEMLSTFLGGLRGGEGVPDWSTGQHDEARSIDASVELTAPSEYAHGLREPIVSYPLVETAWRHARGLSVADHAQYLAHMISRFSAVSADNPHAWKRDRLSPEQVLSTEQGNRMVCYPYTKCMNAYIGVDMAAAVVLTTAATAREFGVPPERWVYLRGAAAATDTDFLSERLQLHACEALAVAGRAALAQSGLTLDELQYLDLYSCFPCAVQVACDALGLAPDDPRGLTVTGGLTLFGGPGNNYSLHAIATMIERLRAGGSGSGMVTANGGYLTKHAVGIYSMEAPSVSWQAPDMAAQQAALDAREHPTLVEHAEGTLTVEGYTVRFSGNEPVGGVVIGRLADGGRCLAHTGSEPSLLAQLMEEELVGVTGQVAPEGEINRLRL